MNDKQQKALQKALLGLVGVGLTVAAAPSHTKKMEKCYGIVKAHMNDCANSRYACAGQEVKDNAPDAWIFVPKGTCKKIVGGSKKPKKSASKKSEKSASKQSEENSSKKTMKMASKDTKKEKSNL